MSFNMKGSVDLGGATGLITTRKQFGTNKNASDHDTVKLGAQDISLKHAVDMGLLDRSAAGVYTSLQTAQAATRVNS